MCASYQKIYPIKNSHQETINEVNSNCNDKSSTNNQYMHYSTDNQHFIDQLDIHCSSTQLNLIKKTKYQYITMKNKRLRTEDGSYAENQFAVEEYEMKLESLTKQYELKLKKQQEYYELRQWKIKQELQNSQEQINCLEEKRRRNQSQSHLQESHCHQCNDGEVIHHLKNILQQTEGNHQGCLENKKLLNKMLMEANSKLTVMEQEFQNMCQITQNSTKQIRALTFLKQKAEQDINELTTILQSKDHKTQDKLKEMEEKLKKTSLENENLQRSLEYFRSRQFPNYNMNENPDELIINKPYEMQKSMSNTYSKPRREEIQQKHMNTLHEVFTSQEKLKTNPNKQHSYTNYMGKENASFSYEGLRYKHL